MAKTSTGISIEADLLNKFKSRYRDKSFSEFVEELVRRELGEIISIDTLEQKIKDIYETYLFLSDKRAELIEIQLKDVERLSIMKRQDLEQYKLKREIELMEWIQKTKDIPEIINLIDIVRQDHTKLLNTKFILNQVDILRTKYPALKLGMFQIRDMLNRVVESQKPQQ